MKTKRIHFFIILLAAIFTLPLVLASCNKANYETDEQGLRYELIMSGYASKTGGYTAYRVRGTPKTAGTITIPAEFKGLRVTTVAAAAFKNAKDLEAVVFENSSLLLSIDEEAFSGCTSLNSINIPSSVFRIYDNAFINSGIWNNSPDNSVVYADKWAVGYKGTIGDVSIKSGTVGISINAFNNCTDLISIRFPSSIVIVGRTFSTPYEPTESALIPGNTNSASAAVAPLYSVFYKCINLKNVVFENGDDPVLIGVRAFDGCTGLENIILSANTGHICPETFVGCMNIKYIELPSSVTAIGTAAFYEWTSEQTINIKGFSSPEDADAAWGTHMMGEYGSYPGGWRKDCDAVIVYSNQ